MDDLTLTEATADDSEFAYQTRKAAFREYVQQAGGWYEEEQRRQHERRFASQDFQVIRWQGTPVGILAVVLETGWLKLNQLFVRPEYQGRGIGTACMKQVISEACCLGRPIRLRVLKVNGRALAFYRGLGFTPIGETDTHILMATESVAGPEVAGSAVESLRQDDTPQPIEGFSPTGRSPNWMMSSTGRVSR